MTLSPQAAYKLRRTGLGVEEGRAVAVRPRRPALGHTVPSLLVWQHLRSCTSSRVSELPYSTLLSSFSVLYGRLVSASQSTVREEQLVSLPASCVGELSNPLVPSLLVPVFDLGEQGVPSCSALFQQFPRMMCVFHASWADVFADFVSESSTSHSGSYVQDHQGERRAQSITVFHASVMSRLSLRHHPPPIHHCSTSSRRSQHTTCYYVQPKCPAYHFHAFPRKKHTKFA